MDGDGDLDLVAGGDDFEWELARILINNGKGSFKKKTKLPINRSQPHIPELSIWDLMAMEIKTSFYLGLGPFMLARQSRYLRIRAT